MESCSTQRPLFCRIVLPVIPYPFWAADYFCLYVLPCFALCLISSFFFSRSPLHFSKLIFNFTPPTRFYLKQPYFISSHLECEQKLQTQLDPEETFIETIVNLFILPGLSTPYKNFASTVLPLLTQENGAGGQQKIF